MRIHSFHGAHAQWRKTGLLVLASLSRPLAQFTARLSKFVWCASVLCLVSACGGSVSVDAPSVAPRTAASSVDPDPLPRALLDWAESMFPGFFPGHPPDQSQAPFLYRHYATGNYLGLDDGSVYLLGPLSGGALANVGSLASFECLVLPARCADQAVTVPNGVAAFSYPLGYRLSGAAYVAQNPCEVVPQEISFPARQLGRYVLPMPGGGPLAPSVQRAIAMKDVWQNGNPVYHDGCSGDTRQAFLRTLERVKALGADSIAVIPWTLIDTSKSVWRIAAPDELRVSTLGDTDLVWAAGAANAAGVKLRWLNQIQGALDYSIPDATVENINKFYDALEPYLLNRAALLQQVGAESMQISCNTCWIHDHGAATQALMASRMATIAPKIRAVFKGKLFYEDLHANAPVALRESVDYNFMTLQTAWAPLTAADMDGLSVAVFKSKLLGAMRGMATELDVSKPMLWSISVPSRADAFQTGYMEETMCTGGFNVLVGDGRCVQRQAVTDFSLQALFHEAALQAIAEDTHFVKHGVQVEYWMTDGISPPNADVPVDRAAPFPNLAVSIRNKPAEAIVRAWFARP